MDVAGAKLTVLHKHKVHWQPNHQRQNHEHTNQQLELLGRPIGSQLFATARTVWNQVQFLEQKIGQDAGSAQCRRRRCCDKLASTDKGLSLLNVS